MTLFDFLLKFIETIGTNCFNSPSKEVENKNYLLALVGRTGRSNIGIAHSNSLYIAFSHSLSPPFQIRQKKPEFSLLVSFGW